MTQLLSVMRVQIKSISFLLIVTVVCTLGMVLQQGASPTKDLLSALMTLLLVITLAISGPLVFGMEFLRGSEDFFATKPVSARKVLGVKLLMLLGIALPIVVAQMWWMEFHSWMFAIIAIYTLSGILALQFWSSAVTLLCRDLVRGILYGVSSFILIIGGSYIFWRLLLIPALRGGPAAIGSEFHSLMGFLFAVFIFSFGTLWSSFFGIRNGGFRLFLLTKVCFAFAAFAFAVVLYLDYNSGSLERAHLTVMEDWNDPHRPPSSIQCTYATEDNLFFAQIHASGRGGIYAASLDRDSDEIAVGTWSTIETLDPVLSPHGVKRQWVPFFVDKNRTLWNPWSSDLEDPVFILDHETGNQLPIRFQDFRSGYFIKESSRTGVMVNTLERTEPPQVEQPRSVKRITTFDYLTGEVISTATRELNPDPGQEIHTQNRIFSRFQLLDWNPATTPGRDRGPSPSGPEVFGSGIGESTAPTVWRQYLKVRDRQGDTEAFLPYAKNACVSDAFIAGWWDGKEGNLGPDNGEIQGPTFDYKERDLLLADTTGKLTNMVPPFNI